MGVEQIDRLAERAKRDLAWLAATHVAVRTLDSHVVDSAYGLLVAPENRLMVRNYSPAEAQVVRKRGIDAFREFCSHARGKPKTNVGHYLNMSAIVYADAIIQTMLLGMYEACFNTTMNCRSIRKQATEIAKQATGFDRIPHARQTFFAAELRHLIVHKGGKVDSRFLDQCKKEKLWQDVGMFAPEDQPVWPDEVAFTSEYVVDKKAPLGIERIVVPCLRHCLRFAEEARTKLRQHLGQP